MGLIRVKNETREQAKFSYGAAPPIATRPCRSTGRPQRRAATVAPARGAAMMVGACTVMRGVHMYHEKEGQL